MSCFCFFFAGAVTLTAKKIPFPRVFSTWRHIFMAQNSDCKALRLICLLFFENPWQVAKDCRQNFYCCCLR